MITVYKKRAKRDIPGDKARVEVGILYFPCPTAYAYIYTEMLNNFICRNIVLFPPS